ncbi:MerR family transcriptional regulator [candidate division TA06 bacterium]|uniref:MerR family transcriptional regulator n=1 Tax=candidate division TA06 bacterium TaxID=2250710 RepID=A0A933I7W9_UNCT6|nr:MerR family transcriptional regulator [candidate division TA06 bacterium]
MSEQTAPATEQPAIRNRQEKLDRMKVYHNIREVSQIAELEPYILRFWESEFTALKPKTTRGGRRLYQVDDIKIVLLIKKLLYQDGYTIAGARNRLKEIKEKERDQLEIPFNQWRSRSGLKSIAGELRQVLEILCRKQPV